MDKVSDLVPGMILEGTVTNVAAFGAFVDVGVHQDGLVHVSAMSNKFISDPHEVVRSGQVVKVKVMEVDVQRQRIGPRCASMMNQASLHNARVAASVVATLAMAPKVAVERAAAAAIPVDVLLGGSMADALKKAYFGK